MNEKIKLHYRDLPHPIEGIVALELRWEESGKIFFEVFTANLDANGSVKGKVCYKTASSNLSSPDPTTISMLGAERYKKEIENTFDNLIEGEKRHLNCVYVNPEMCKAGEYSFLFSESRLPWYSYDISEISKFYDFYKEFLEKVYTKTTCQSFKDSMDFQAKIRSLFTIEPIEDEF
ncbi:hypothetical protein [uncultured Treponema sp.]|uniref:hypothetical protein n=1 Tax=uncultured Treponema sp. TaxID=162155 RepID=UPI002588E9D0|nr:hypothetical protein [uncultured Treponema sp.]